MVSNRKIVKQNLFRSKNSITFGLVLVLVVVAAAGGLIIGLGSTFTTLLAMYLGYKLLRLVLRVIRLIFSLIFSVVSIVIVILILSFLIF